VAFFRRISKILSLQSGFSLTEVTIGAAILTGVALTSAQLFKNERTSQRSTELDQKLSFYHQSLTKILNMAENCNATMKMLFPVASPVTPIPITTIYTCSSYCSDPNTGNLNYDAYISGSYSGSPLISVNQYIDKTDTWYVCEMNIVEGRVTSGLVRMRIGYCMNPRLKNFKIYKDIFLNTRFSDGLFRECIDGKENAVTNLQNDLCKTLSLGGGPATSTGTIATWDEASQTCKVTGSITCPAGQMVDGVGADGKAKCKNMVNNTDAEALSDPSTTANCTPGQKTQVYFDNGKVKIRCVP